MTGPRRALRHGVPSSPQRDEEGIAADRTPDVTCEQGADDAERPAAPEFLTVEELADLVRVNRKTIYDALARGDIPGARRVGGTYRILRDAVLSWFASGQGCVSRSRRYRR